MDKHDSLIIKDIRFPLLVLVIMVHTDVGIDFQNPLTSFLYNNLRLLANMAVPCFFFISGYLYFNGVTTITSLQYKEKLKKRIKTLCVPYICWNALYLIFILMLQLLIPDIIGNERKYILNYSLLELVNSFWNYGGVYYGMPVLYSMWYIRDLIVLIICSPIIYFCLKRIPYAFLMIVLWLFIFNPFSFTPTDCDWIKALMFFSIGGKLALDNCNFLIKKKYSMILCVLFLFAYTYYFFVRNTSWGYNVMLVICVFIIPKLYTYISDKCALKQPPIYSQSVMFVYAFHLFIIMVFNKFWGHIIPVNEYTGILMLAIIPILTAYSCLGVFLFCKKMFPSLTGILVGGRL